MTSIYRPPTAGRHKFKPSEYNSALSLIPETVCESDITLLGNTIVPENPRNWNLHDVLLNIPARQTFSNPVIFINNAMDRNLPIFPNSCKQFPNFNLD